MTLQKPSGCMQSLPGLKLHIRTSEEAILCFGSLDRSVDRYKAAAGFAAIPAHIWEKPLPDADGQGGEG